MSFNKNFSFATPSNYTYDSDLIEITGGVGKLKDRRESGWALYDNFSNATNATYGRGTLTRTLTNATITGGELDCTGGTPKTANYENNNLTSLVEEVKIDFKFKPDFNASPGDTPFLFHLAIATANQIQCYVTSTGSITVRAYDSSGTYAVNRTVAKTDWVQDQEYRFVLFLKSGDSRLYLDDVLQWTDTNTWTRTSQNLILYVGNSSGKANPSHFKFDDFYVSSSVGSYETDSTYNIYSTLNPTITINETWLTDGIISAAETSTITGSDNIKYAWKKGASGYYWNGSAWTLSTDLTDYTQTSTNSDNNANAASFTTTSITFGVVVFLHSDDGMTTPDIDLLSFAYDFAGEPEDIVETCVVWGYSKNEDGSIDTTPVTACITTLAAQYKTNTVIIKSLITDTPDSNTGLWKLVLVESENMEDGVKYNIVLNGKDYYRDVPNQAEAAFWELT